MSTVVIYTFICKYIALELIASYFLLHSKKQEALNSKSQTNTSVFFICIDDNKNNWNGIVNYPLSKTRYDWVTIIWKKNL